MATTQALPVVLVHGMIDSSADMKQMGNHLSTLGFQCYYVDLVPNFSVLPVREYALQLSKQIDDQLGTTQKFHLVGFSMGGLTALAYLTLLNKRERVATLVSVSGPLNGSVWAHLLPTPACRDMQPGSELLNEIKAALTDADLQKITTVYTPYDGIIMPAQSAALAGATNIELPIVFHRFMSMRTEVFDAVADALT